MLITVYKTGKNAHCAICKHIIIAGCRRAKVNIRQRTEIVHPLCLKDLIQEEILKYNKEN